MKSLIILKGLDRKSKLRWIEKEKLGNYFLDLDILRRMYSMPDLICPDREILGKSFSSVVRRNYLDILITRLGKGCLVVTDTGDELTDSLLETLALIFGYTVFYVIWDIPQDYLGKPRKYNPDYYILPKRNELEKKVSDFLNLQLGTKNIITSYSDVLDYWKENEPRYKVGWEDTVLHVSDLHSNLSLYNKLPKLKNYKLVVFHGDYIDGPEVGGSRTILGYAKNGVGKNTVWLEGNHELRVRKYLGANILKGDALDILKSSIPDDFLKTTASEFSDLDFEQSKAYLEAMNKNLKMYIIIEDGKNTYICTHSGITLPDIIDPRYIGNVIYGNREMSRVDKTFTDFTKDNNIYSVHAHCKYSGDWIPNKFKKVINLDPKDETTVVCGERKKGEWNIWEIENSK
jgi:predicted kinase